MLNREKQIYLAPFFGYCYYLAKPWPHVQMEDTDL